MHPMTNTPREITKKQVAAQLKETARLLDVLGTDAFRAKAYASAARNVEGFEGDIAELLYSDRLHEIRGVGKGLADEIYALKTAEHLPVLEELYEQVPEGVRSLFVVSGLGAKKVAALWGIGIENLEQLEAAALDGRVAELKGFGRKSAEKISAGASFALAARKRMRMNVAQDLEYALVGLLAESLPDAKVAITGSQRRKLETVGNLNVLVSGVSSQDLIRVLEEPLLVEESTDQSVHVTLEGRDIFINLVEPAAFGAALLVQTGNDDYVTTLLEAAGKRGLELTPDGLFENGKLTEMSSEKDVLERLELSYIVPERRESVNPQPVVNLIVPDDIRGQVHNHSTWSDAVHSLREMVAAARELGYSYLAMADHSRTSYYANGLSIERVYAQAKEIAEIRAELTQAGSDFGLLHGVEVDILSEGELDYPDEVLATLDYTVISVHQNFTLSKAKQTDRIVTAIHNPYAKILGHATGRILLQRPSYAVDQQALIEACAETGTVIEINASPYRLDMDWRWAIKAKELGCTFSVNPDAHHRDGFRDVYYGTMMARKAGLTAADVVNTAPDAAKFLANLK